MWTCRCDEYGYGERGVGQRMGETLFDLPGHCTHSRPMGALASVYFCVVVAVGVGDQLLGLSPFFELDVIQAIPPFSSHFLKKIID